MIDRPKPAAADEHLVALLREAMRLTDSQHARADEIRCELEAGILAKGWVDTAALARLSAQALLSTMADEQDRQTRGRMERLFGLTWFT